jgi:Ca2+-binding EF-hand superfamily protein
MIGKLQQIKFLKYFDCFDTDRDGIITEQEYYAPVHALLALIGQTGTPAAEQALAFTNVWWQGLRSMADTNRDGVLTREEWLAFWSAQSDVLAEAALAGEAGAALLAKIKETVMVIVNAMDSDHDGTITVDEYGKWLQSLNIKSDVPKLFRRFGATGDGLTLAQTEYLLLDFFFSNNPEAPGNHMMGELS